ncbi:hypothetical protein VT06_15255 [Arsukibacterium sp. MJ3]|uniref:DUF421 domain-containing protein n=1 Tax=Arsukibacterium sp. MJ3 TaxID=1632859 RepID=UPI0006272FE8|nr:YetF domain-containing protein [Arsukibacterium sp. MJ3]KKO47791.1 hypothetical protein VT06_15255 [Arsukibacterium sp. MJ3]
MFISNPVIDMLLRGVILTTIAMIWVVLLVRINGLRSFSKMTNFDFVMTVAIGSLLAGSSQSTSWIGFIQALIAMVMLFSVQYATARLRKMSHKFESIIQNTPVLLMKDGVIIDEALLKTRVAKDDLIAKLRESNVLDFSQVRAVVLETTGDISVLHGEYCSPEMLMGTHTYDL